MLLLNVQKEPYQIAMVQLNATHLHGLEMAIVMEQISNMELIYRVTKLSLMIVAIQLMPHQNGDALMQKH